ncbi:kinesin-like protein KIN-7E isoform X1 [Camellia sinensis]|uniref:kinesin-like protein KIN-7E isoform X1 n=1 Tax=Camellia sinensis TaxID=4442 RepID=UPI001036A098|nr:kinesin-like protein KIN-7E isoform X1 [Camellia sinensis]XP_028109559.1 kinesin-like protein KIN-7E isoform X1 [Camellia sinensis]XP_028109560.1 kinesin-like protein KIN-7E isoform X1 [Camellia sinensis]XP_028109561.1 kinesin-like protein KIN-7E isoform X1 [Camellia sinensis]
MGAIGGEELTKWEEMQGVASDGSEEKILVLVRLRPLSEKEIARNEVSDWECINETTILFRNSLQERSMFPTAHTFDGVFSGDCSTRQVYEQGTKEIALSVVSGINSSIFAYGQTSSGKTYTMIGITEYTVADIYDYIHRHEDRAFVLKFSAMEIYNEAVRDLLSTDSLPLRVLDDPEKGTVVEKLTEETLRDWSHLKGLLSICEAQRKIGETTLNETSSRSHQILRLTIESSSRECLGKDNSTTLAASVNFVDLAGSERASQALSVGARLKEGCHINRSLLTLGTVIRKLSNGRHGHVNYRDSKLTRILQSCLGGNARTAIICTLSPARSHVEQSRNTLLFATCAKEVTTNAKVNVVMSDKALVKQLQREVARLESELRTPAPSSTCDHAALLRKKDLQIEKLEKEVRELTKQRDLAESRYEDLLLMVGNDQASGNDEDDSVSMGASSLLSDRGKFVRSSACQGREVFALGSGEDPDDICKEVRCIEMDESNKDKISETLALSTDDAEGMLALTPVPICSNVEDEETESTPPREVSHIQNNLTYGTLEQRIRNVQKTIDSRVSPYPDDPSPWSQAAGISSSRSRKLSRSWSCRANLMAGSSSPYFNMARESHNTPPNGFETSFPGRPGGFQRMLPQLNYDAPRLSRNDSQSSIGSAFIDELKAQKNMNSTDEEIPSIDNFVAGLKEMAKVEYEKQLADCQVQGMEPKAEKSGKNVKDVGLDPMQDTPESPASWPLEFERRQKEILQLWQSCNISLVHRTYFFLLFKGDPTDSIYMEVELRRLSFLKEALSRGNHVGEDGQTLTLASSLKALRREREMLRRLMYKRYSAGERNRLYQKWGISLGSKRRRLQLVNCLWSNASDINHTTESAMIVGKLIMFSEQGEALKEMFGLSFTRPCTSRRSFGWKNSMVSLL